MWRTLDWILLQVWHLVQSDGFLEINKQTNNNRKHIKCLSSLMLSNLWEVRESQSDIFLFVMAQIFPEIAIMLEFPCNMWSFSSGHHRLLVKVNCKNDPAFRSFQYLHLPQFGLSPHTTYFSDTLLSFLVLPAFQKKQVPSLMKIQFWEPQHWILRL